MFPRSVPYEHNPPRRDNILTVAMPGVTSSRAQLCRYTGPEDGVFVLQNWADGFEPLVAEDGDRNVNKHRSFLQVLKRAIWLLLHLRDDEKSPREEPTQQPAGHDVRGADADRPAASPSHYQNGSAAHEHAESIRSSSVGSPPSSLMWSRRTAGTAAEDFPFTSPLPTPPVRCYATSRISCRVLHNMLPSPEVTEMRHRRWWCTLNPVHWMLVMKEIGTCLLFAVRPIQLCHSELGRTSMAGLTDQLMFTREVQRAVELIQSQAARHGASRPHATRAPAHAARANTGGRTLKEAQHDVSEPAAPLADSVADGDEEEGGLSESVPRPYVRPYLVLFGCSRGATACLYTAMKIPRCLARYVSLIILEAPFDTLRNVIDSSSLFPNFNLWLFKAFCDHGGIDAERAAYTYDAARVQIRCPVAFIMSTRDKRVPNSVTQVLIDGVQKNLVPHAVPAVEVLTLTHSRHPCMATGHREDQARYVDFVEGLYDKYCSGVPPPLP